MDERDRIVPEPAITRSELDRLLESHSSEVRAATAQQFSELRSETARQFQEFRTANEKMFRDLTEECDGRFALKAPNSDT